MKSIAAILLIGVFLSLSMLACSRSSATSATRAGPDSMTENEKHRLYAAALAAIESPLESETFKEVCRKIGIFDTQGSQNDNYLAFVTAHIEWVMKPENEPFKREINTREKAREYVEKYLP